MASHSGYNKNSSAVKRIMQEARELANDPSTDYHAAPLEDDIFEWHCTLRGTPGSEFEGGVYHFRILLPSEYPFRPPSIMMLTPNGRFELNTKICISFTNYHEELWQPAWGVRTAIIGLQGFFPLKGTAAVGVGAIEYPPVERKRLAQLSRHWVCPTCQKSNLECLPDPPASGESSSTSEPNSDLPSGDAIPPAENTLFGVNVDRALEFLEASATTTVADPVPAFGSTQITIQSPPLIAPKPIRPIDAGSIIAPASPSRPSTPLPSGPPLDELRERRLPPPPTPSVQTSRAQTPMSEYIPLVLRRSTPRPPILLDTAICVLLVLVFALICRRVL
ncbi:hypothetical protein PHLGIDRAFT_31212 [Phlebiopsis gigantea 11061_1 CR5-6]|uniref:UBC core domain-containing protein n=1 Tax=Phlebiopsis gigantea (strain 11061_1 CR5-6) TaxID=745531 RepID=A0A0C3PGD2_PHLG1|nr:hypothetical protein PHLGIDRAFT_31212 [Phlebiopsis gigantea 11061_1 CR5-6]